MKIINSSVRLPAALYDAAKAAAKEDGMSYSNFVKARLAADVSVQAKRAESAKSASK